ncbi:MAG TPA: histidine phosphatase family protein [Nitrososphaeraceae archaeon]|jgi:probable phosphoglycerate mutase|nr:histidine phosphatase family protein [Nitrososphaeraceae archaeon]
MRHGQADNNVNRVLVGRHLESHLTEKGQMQVKETAKLLKSMSISKIYSSPVTRAIETTQIVGEELGLDYEIDDRLYEIDLGKLAGTNYDEVLNKYGNLFLSFYMGDDSVLSNHGVESFTAVKSRIRDLLDQVMARHDNHNVLLVTHLDPIKAAISYILDLKPESLYKWHMRNAALTILKQEFKTWSISAVNFMGAQRYLYE